MLMQINVDSQMCHHSHKDHIKPREVPDQSVEIPQFFCQKGVAYFHQSTKLGFCQDCFNSLPRRYKLNWIRVIKHNITISGYYIGLNCDSCRGYLTIIRPGLSCTECRNKYLEFMILASAENLVIDDLIEITIERQVTPMNAPENQ